MAKKLDAKMSEQDWQNLRLQLKTLVDIYCKQNDEMMIIKDSLKKMVKIMTVEQKRQQIQSMKKPNYFTGLSSFKWASILPSWLSK
jgi:hypothetical protein